MINEQDFKDAIDDLKKVEHSPKLMAIIIIVAIVIVGIIYTFKIKLWKPAKRVGVRFYKYSRRRIRRRR